MSQFTTTLTLGHSNQRVGSLGLGDRKDHLLPACHQIIITYFTSNIHEAYQRKISSQFFVTQLGIEPETPDLKDERVI